MSVTPQELGFSEAADLVMVGELDAALERYRALREAAPVPSFIGEGSVHYRRGDYGEALACFERVVAAEPENLPGRVLKALSLSRVGRLQESLELADALLGEEPAIGTAHLARGHVLTRLERYDEAAVAYGRTLELIPGLPEAHLGLAIVKAQQRKEDEAIPHLIESIKGDPTYAQPYKTFGTMMLVYGAYHIGIELLEQFGVGFTEDPEVVYLLCHLYARAGLQDDLRLTLDLLDQMAAEQPDTDVAQASLRLEADQPERAVELLQRALDAGPDPAVAAEAYYHLGLAREALGDVDGACGEYRRAAAENPTHWESHNNLAASLLTPRSAEAFVEPLDEAVLAEAEAHLELARQSATLHPEVVLNRGLLVLRRGDPSAARELFKRVANTSEATAQLRQRARQLLAAVPIQFT